MHHKSVIIIPALQKTAFHICHSHIFSCIIHFLQLSFPRINISIKSLNAAQYEQVPQGCTVIHRSYLSLTVNQESRMNQQTFRFQHVESDFFLNTKCQWRLYKKERLWKQYQKIP